MIRNVYIASAVDVGCIYKLNDGDEKVHCIIANGSPECHQVHSTALHDIHVGTIVRNWKSSCKDGTSAEFVQPTGIYTESNTIFIADTAMGYTHLVPEITLW